MKTYTTPMIADRGAVVALTDQFLTWTISPEIEPDYYYKVG